MARFVPARRGTRRTIGVARSTAEAKGRRSSPPSGPAGVLRLQADAGNAAVGRILGVQRDAPAPPVPTVGPATALGQFSPTTAYVHSGERFSLRYDPAGPLPKQGTATVTLKIHVEFKDFDATMMRRPEFRRHRWTAAQRAQFAWPPEQQRLWVGKFSDAVSAGWKEKHAFVLDEPGFEKYRANCDVKVEHVDKAADANTSITAQWVPPGAPRLRSAVWGGSTAELDARDVDEPETHKVPMASVVRQIGPFDFDSAAITPTVAASIDDFVNAVKRAEAPGRPLAGPSDDISLSFVGRASSKGSVGYNRKLAQRRAEAVTAAIDTRLDFLLSMSNAVGEEHATEDPTFQRVDAQAVKGSSQDVQQNVAAHEAGHMFGLGDEYVDEVPPTDVVPKFQGDRARHDADVRATMGDEAADELLVQDAGSMMSEGSEVKAGHYVYFLKALDAATGHTWKVE